MSTSKATLTVHALDAGHITLPERSFVVPHDPEASRYVPSLAFLVQHTTPDTNTTTRIVFDLGLRRDLSLYPSKLEEHCKARAPISTQPDVVASLARGGLTPSDIDYVILSHVHYDHIGYPKDFDDARTKFIVGHGARALLSGEVTLHGTHSVFEPDLLPQDRSIELPPVETSWDYKRDPEIDACSLRLSNWTSLPPFTHVMDIFGDASVYVVNAPGHLPGHINLLCRLTPLTDPPTQVQPPSLNVGSHGDGTGNANNNDNQEAELSYVLLAADACHDDRLFQGTHSIATWQDSQGNKCCIHADIAVAQQTIATIKRAADHGINIIDPDHNTSKSGSGSGTGKYMTIGDQTIEIQKGWFGDPRAQDPGRMDEPSSSLSSTSPPGMKKRKATVEVVMAHDEVWEQDAKTRNRFWPGQL